MQKILHATIGENQSAAIKNRTILHKLPTIRDVTDLSNKSNNNLALLFLNFMEIFNRVDWDFMPFKVSYRKFVLCKLTLPFAVWLWK